MRDLPRDYRETLIRLDHDAGVAELWTENRALIGRAKRCGWTVKKTWGRGVWMSGPLRGVLIRKAPSHTRSQTHAGRFKRRPDVGAVVQT